MLSTVASQSVLPKRPVTSFRILRFGLVEVDRPAAGPDQPLWFTRDQAESIVGAFRRLGRPLAIDYEHQSDPQYNTRADGLVPAAGWVGDLEIRPDGLWATNVKWTPTAATLLRAGEFRYFVPMLLWAGTFVDALGSVTLTNDAALRGAEPLVAARNHGGFAMSTSYLSVLSARTPGPDLDPASDEVRAEVAKADSALASRFRRLPCAVQREFDNDPEAYAAYQRAADAGLVTVLKNTPGCRCNESAPGLPLRDDPAPAVPEADLVSAFRASPAYQRAFEGDFEAFVRYARGCADGGASLVHKALSRALPVTE